MLPSVDEFQEGTRYAKPAVRVWNDAVFTLTTGVAGIPTFNQEAYDRWGMHSTSSNTERLTVQVPGLYHVGAHIQFQGDAGATGRRIVNINHWDSGGTKRLVVCSLQYEPVGTNPVNVYVVGNSLHADVGDYFTLDAFQDSGGNLNIAAATAVNQHKQSFWAYWVARE